jgi:hypothetical protein
MTKRDAVYAEDISRQANIVAAWVVGLAIGAAHPVQASDHPPLQGWGNQQLCGVALNIEKTDWDKRTAVGVDYADFVIEAKHRNLSVSDCRVAMGMPPS